MPRAALVAQHAEDHTAGEEALALGRLEQAGRAECVSVPAPSRGKGRLRGARICRVWRILEN